VSPSGAVRGRQSRRLQASIVALAGRRIDAVDTPSERFPLDQVGTVARRLRATFRSLKAHTLVCAAANGADLVALRVAQELGMRCRIVLPFSATRFRRVSVTDRPGGELWGWLFDDLVARARADRDLIMLPRRRGGDTLAFAAANERIIKEARRLARGPISPGRSGQRRAVASPIAVVVWEGGSRGKGDTTAGFAQLARAAGLRVKPVRSRA